MFLLFFLLEIEGVMVGKTKEETEEFYSVYMEHFVPKIVAPAQARSRGAKTTQMGSYLRKFESWWAQLCPFSVCMICTATSRRRW